MDVGIATAFLAHEASPFDHRGHTLRRPQANVQHLMLRKDLVDACRAGRFAIYPVSTVSDRIALLTGLAAGERDFDGKYPLGSVNRCVKERLRAFASIRKRFDSRGGGGVRGIKMR